MDSTAGGIASPILPDERLLSLPIKAGDGKSKTRYRDIWMKGVSIGKLVEDLSRDTIHSKEFVHLDPDLRAKAMSRLPGWKPLFGPLPNRALMKQDVAKGDIFLFFGRFHNVRRESDRQRYVFDKEKPIRHVIYGWLQISERWNAGPAQRTLVPKWARYHPHFLNDNWGNNNSVYVATDKMKIPGLKRSIAGAGVFEHFSQDLCLSETGKRMSQWMLPFEVVSRNGIYPLSRFQQRKWWSHKGANTLLNTDAGFWQEAVLDGSKCPNAVKWLIQLLKDHAG